MMRGWTAWAAAATLAGAPHAMAQSTVDKGQQAAPQPVPPAPPADPQQASRTDRLDQAVQLMSDGKPADAVAILDPLLAEYETLYKDQKSTIFCAEDTAESLLYMTQAIAGGGRKDVVTIENDWCLALWAKDYALIDLQRLPEAVSYLERAVAMAPARAHFLSELGYAYQALRQWDKSYDAYARAAQGAERYEGERRTRELGRAWRGMGFVLIETGKLDEAEALFNKCLALDPADEKAKSELQYIADQRKRGT